MECHEALGHAESLLSQDLTLTDVSPALITELYAMLAESYANLHDELNQTIALEKRAQRRLDMVTGHNWSACQRK